MQSNNGLCSVCEMPIGICVKCNGYLARDTVLAHVANFYDPTQGYPAGAFVTALLTAMARADAINLDKLALGFPAYVVAMRERMS